MVAPRTPDLGTAFDSRHHRGPTLVATGPRPMRPREAAQPHARGPGCTSVGAGAFGYAAARVPEADVRSTRRGCSHFRGRDVALSGLETVARLSDLRLSAICHQETLERLEPVRMGPAAHLELEPTLAVLPLQNCMVYVRYWLSRIGWDD